MVAQATGSFHELGQSTSGYRGGRPKWSPSWCDCKIPYFTGQDAQGPVARQAGAGGAGLPLSHRVQLLRGGGFPRGRQAPRPNGSAPRWCCSFLRAPQSTYGRGSRSWPLAWGPGRSAATLQALPVGNLGDAKKGTLGQRCEATGSGGGRLSCLQEGNSSGAEPGLAGGKGTEVGGGRGQPSHTPDYTLGAPWGGVLGTWPSGGVSTRGCVLTYVVPLRARPFRSATGPSRSLSGSLRPERILGHLRGHTGVK